MNGKSGKVVFILLLLVGLVLGNALAQYLSGGSVSAAGIIGVFIGCGLAALIVYIARRNRPGRWIGVILLALLVPVAFTGLVSLLLSLFNVSMGITELAAVYLLGFVTVLFFAVRRDGSLLFRDVPGYDERQLAHFAWAGAWSFLFLFFMIIGALVQPWIDLNEQGLWVAVLSAGVLFWIINMAILGFKK